MSKYEIIELSAYTTPEIVEDKKNDWVQYGSDNDYFKYLIDRYNGSTTNNAIINGISRFIYGKGIFAKDSDTKLAQWSQFLTMLNPSCTKKIIKDKKILGMASMQVLYVNKVPVKIEHFPMETLRPEKANEEGEIKAWYYHKTWNKTELMKEKPERIDAYGFGNGTKPEILVWKDYCPFMYYFSPVDYKGALPYAVLEEEISDYLINDTINGFSGTKIVNFNNGVPDDEKRDEITNNIKSKLSGSKGDKIIVAFNDGKENQVELTDVQLNNAPEHYSYLAEECFRKLIVGHSITSPMLLGIRDGNSGLGNNSDEIKVATQLFQSTTIEPVQRDFIDLIKPVLAKAGLNLDLYFKSTEPIEFQDELTAQTDQSYTGIQITSALEVIERYRNGAITISQATNILESMLKIPKETVDNMFDLGINLSKQTHEDFTEDEGFQMLDTLAGEIVNEDEWELVEKREVKADNEPTEVWAEKLLNKVNLWTKLANFIKSNSSEKSSLDEGFYKVRYEYSERHSSDNSRSFCRQMMARTNRGVVYRKEDIDQASFQGVNRELGHQGRAYSLFQFKGGVNCGHYWSENLYRLKRKENGQFVKDKSLASNEEVDSITGYNPNPSGWDNAQIAPKDMPNNGHHPNYR
jgi:hypothetical protein